MYIQLFLLCSVQKKLLRCRCNLELIKADDVELPPSLFVFLPKQLSEDDAMFPQVDALTRFNDMAMHTVCFEDCYLMGETVIIKSLE